MNIAFRYLIISLFLACTFSILPAQITITKSDIDANFINARWVQISDSTTQLLDLGTASSSSQSFNFSNITFAPATATYDSVNYVTPAGHLRAQDFPTAAACDTFKIDTTISGFTSIQTFATYFSSESNGTYNLGYVNRQQYSPAPPPPIPADTTVESIRQPA
jgi:hypothetical protein